MLTQNVKEIIDISESTLYPVLRRLQNNDYVKLNTGVEQYEYNYNISSGVGDLDVFGTESRGTGTVSGNSDGRYKMVIKTDVGDITVEE